MKVSIADFRFKDGKYFYDNAESIRKAYFKYEGVAYETFSVYSILNYLNKKKGVQVRLVLEGEGKEERFCNYCSILEKIYTNINFFGGYVENTKRQIYAFKHTLLFPKIDWVKKLR